MGGIENTPAASADDLPPVTPSAENGSPENNQYTLTPANLKSIGIGALINLAGTALFALGDFLIKAATSMSFTMHDLSIFGYLLLGNLGAVLINTVRKFRSPE